MFKLPYGVEFVCDTVRKHAADINYCDRLLRCGRRLGLPALRQQHLHADGAGQEQGRCDVRMFCVEHVHVRTYMYVFWNFSSAFTPV